MNLLENGSFRVYCTVYEYPQITCRYLTDFWHYSFVFLFFSVLFCFSFQFCLFCTIILKKLDMVCCAWNLNIFNNETLFYEAKKLQKCHDILRMSHCILWCHFHCIWWINKWWQEMLMRFLDVASFPKTFSEQNKQWGLSLKVKRKKAKKKCKGTSPPTINDHRGTLHLQSGKKKKAHVIAGFVSLQLLKGVTITLVM